MIQMKCQRCGFTQEILTEGIVNLGCQVCGCSEISFSEDIKRRSALDGFEEKVKAGEVVKSSYKRSYAWIIKSDKKVAPSIKKVTPTRKRARKKK